MSNVASRLPKVSINGVLLVDKPQRFTSNQIISQIKRFFRPKKIGHLGTLDPLATGMLPLVMGDATKFASYGLSANKCYRVRMQLGIQTDSFDADGSVVFKKPVPKISIATIEDVLLKFSGTIDQIPPVYSALKWQGKPMYAWIREGRDIDSSVLEQKKRRVTIDQIKLIDWGADFIECLVYCSKGTYIRSLVNDIGIELGSFAYVAELRRVFSDPFQNHTMYCLAQLQEFSANHNLNCVLPVDCLLQHIPRLDICNQDKQLLIQGQPVNILGLEQNGLYRLYSDTIGFFGLGEQRYGRCWPKRLCSEILSRSKADNG